MASDQESARPEGLGFRVKVCGITRPQDALDVTAIAQRAACDLAIGLNFCATSKRYVTPSVARHIVKALDANLVGLENSHRPALCRPLWVGVFVEQDLAEASRTAKEVGLDRIQLHGDHDLEGLENSEFPILYVVRLTDGSGASLPDQLSNWVTRVNVAIQKGAPIVGLLIDTFVAGQFGGTGKALDWESLSDFCAPQGEGKEVYNRQVASIPIVLAGGLTPENVSRAIDVSAVHAVDVAGGVEECAGIKSKEKMLRFIQAASDQYKNE